MTRQRPYRRENPVIAEFRRLGLWGSLGLLAGAVVVLVGLWAFCGLMFAVLGPGGAG